jgi:expansin (peptidoglycan-binding protein)
VKLCRNTTISNIASNSTIPINEFIALMAWKNLTSGTFQNFTSKQYGFFGVTDGITSDTEINNLNTIIANFQTALSRNV